MKSISVVGVGRVGGAMALGLAENGYRVDKLFYRHEPVHAREIGSKIPGSDVEQFETGVAIDSDIVLITTQDAEIPSVARQLTERIRGRPMFFHTSGALSSKVLDGLAVKGYRTGSIHPLVSVSDPEAGVGRFRESYFCVEGHPDSVKEAELIVHALGGISFTIDSQYKTLYHAAAVTACGHLVALFDAAVEMMTKCGLDEAYSKKILLPLVNSTIQNLNEQSTASALTGTFARADVDTFVRHLQALNNVSEELLEIYLLLGERSLELASKQGVSRCKDRNASNKSGHSEIKIEVVVSKCG